MTSLKPIRREAEISTLYWYCLQTLSLIRHKYIITVLLLNIKIFFTNVSLTKHTCSNCTLHGKLENTEIKVPYSMSWLLL